MIHAFRSLTTIETRLGYNILLGDKSNTNWTVDSVNWKGLSISQIKKKLITIYCLNANFILCMCIEKALLKTIHYT